MRYLMLSILILATSLSACAQQLGTWSKIDMTSWDKDHYTCIKEAKYADVSGGPYAVGTKVKISRRIYQLCMKAGGYQETG